MEKQFRDLVLLVGTNPLPNYVVAKYFIQSNPHLRTIWLVYSERQEHLNEKGTQEYAENIEKVLKGEFQGQREIDVKKIALRDISDAKIIAADIDNKLLRNLSLDSGVGGVHLNYTGGTKAMSVHVYRVMEQRQKNCTFSYLDARDFKLKNDQEGPMTGDLRNLMDISLTNLMDLHGYEKKSEQNNPDFPPVLHKLKELIDNGRIKGVTDWMEGFLRPVYFSAKGFCEKPKSFWEHNRLTGDQGEWDEVKVSKLKEKFNEKTPSEIMALLKLIPPENSLLAEDGQLWLPIPGTNNKSYQERLEPTVKNYLGGKWLEAYVDMVIQKKLAAHEDLTKKYIMESNWEIQKNDKSKHFELDVIMVNGYQVCGISCTTDSTEGICKEKGFEVLHRVNQIGGDEAKAILITCLEDEKLDRVANDLKNISGSGDKKLRVIGVSELQEELLWKAVKRHIWGEL